MTQLSSLAPAQAGASWLPPGNVCHGTVRGFSDIESALSALYDPKLVCAHRRSGAMLQDAPAVPLDRCRPLVDRLDSLRRGSSTIRSPWTEPSDSLRVARRLHLLNYIGPPPDELLRTLCLRRLGLGGRRRRRRRRRVGDLRRGLGVARAPHEEEGAGDGERECAAYVHETAFPRQRLHPENYPYELPEKQSLRQACGEPPPWWRRTTSKPADDMSYAATPKAAATWVAADDIETGRRHVVCRHPRAAARSDEPPRRRRAEGRARWARPSPSPGPPAGVESADGGLRV